MRKQTEVKTAALDQEDEKKVKCLDELDLLKLNNFVMKLNLEKQKNVQAEKEIETKTLLMENLRLRISAITNEVGSIREKVKINKGKYDIMHDEYRAYIDILSDKYQLSKGWGFDEETGEIAPPPEQQQ
jgi:hypothetical protein